MTPLLKGDDLWGLLCVNQCDDPRHWQDFEIEFVKQVAAQLSAARQQTEYTELLEKRADRESILTKITTRMIELQNEEVIFRFATRETRRFLNADRVVVFRFDPDSGYNVGTVVAEDVLPTFTSALQAQVEDHSFGQHVAKYREGYHWAAADIYAEELPDCHITILERFQVRANLVTPLLKGDDLWGLLCVNQCDGPRHWQDFEIEFVKRVAAQLSAARQQAEYIDLVEQRANRESILAKITSRTLQADDEQSTFSFATREIRQLLKADRVIVFQFDPKSNHDRGKVLAEDVLPEFSSALQAQIDDHCFGKNTEKYRQGYHWAAADIYTLDLADCFIAILERFQVRADLVVPMLKGPDLWGLLCVHQCSASRQWQDFEIEFVKRAAALLSITREKTDYIQQLTQSVRLERLMSKVVARIRQTSDIETIFNATLQAVRSTLKVEHVAIYQFRPDFFGDFVAESESGGFPKLVGSGWEDTYVQEHQGGRLRDHEPFVADDIYTASLSDCHIETLEHFEVKAFALVAIFQGQKLWGILSTMQHSGPRYWQEKEVNLLNQIGVQLGTALQQAEYTQQLAQKAERERTIAKVATRLRQTLDVDAIFAAATQEVRQVLGVERVAIYKFRPDFFGDFVAESEAGGFPKLVGSGWEDTYVQEHQGGRLLDRQPYVADNVYTAGLSDCHIETLEHFGVKSFALVAVFQGQKLWGILTAIQHNGPRHWTEEEIKLLTQIADQLGTALQQAEYTQQLTQKAERERAIAKVATRLRQTLDAEEIFAAATQEVRQVLGVERVAIYKFRPDYFGDFVAESESGGFPKLVGSGWEDTYVQEHQGGRLRNNQPFVADDVYQAGLSDCHIETLEHFGVKSFALTAIFQGQKLWGLMSAFQHSGPRHWRDDEVQLLSQIATQLGTALQQAEYTQQLAQKAEREQVLAKAATRLRQTLDIDAIFTTVTQEVRQVLKIERVTIYKFRPDFFGDFVSESEASGLSKLVGSSWEDTYLREHQGGRFRDNEPLVVDNIYTADLDECHVETLEHLGVKSCMVVAIFKGPTLWGLLSAYQHSGPYHWKEEEVSLLTQISAQLGTALQQAEYTQQLAKSAEREQAASKIISKIRQTLDINIVFTTTTEEIRRLLRCDRVGIYQFNPDWSGEFVAESVTSEWSPLLQVQVDNPRLRENISECSAKELERGSIQSVDTYLQQTQGGRYSKGELFRVANNIYESGFSDCYINILEQYQAKAYVIVAIYKGQELWGLLAAYQNSGPRQWESEDINTLVQLGAQLGVAIQQAESLAAVQSRNQELARLAERERNFLRIIDKVSQSIIDKIRLSQGIETIFEATLYQLRQLFQADRTLIYRFNPDWSGEFVAESVARGWSRVMGVDSPRPHHMVKYLHQARGEQYGNHDPEAVEDIHLADHDPYYIEFLEQLEARAYAMAPIFAGETLWGLLGVYQNSGPRQWDPLEVNLLAQIGSQLGVALRQSKYLEQLQSQAEQLTAAAEREKIAKQTLQNNVLELLTAVRPALEGNLTVRAPVTEDEVGTVADAYNSTLRVLRKIVTQVQTAANQVGQTSQSSSSAVIELSQQAQQEVQELTQALEQVQAMAQATQAVADSAQQVDQAVHQANQAMNQGDAAMNRAVEGIQAIRTTVSETSKKIKRLSESSQKISKVVNLINDFTDQTQLLALNAAIEATRAGEYGRGFAVVADEIRSLAQRSTEATTDIEKLIEEIQSETMAVATAMDTDIEQVVKGTHLVDETRQSLNAIVAITGQISQRVEDITQSTQAQTQQSQSVTDTMIKVVEIANQSSDKSTHIATFFQELLTTAEDLQATVGKFTVN